METNGKESLRRKGSAKLPILEDSLQQCDFTGYDPDALMKETSKLRKTNNQKRNA